MKPLHFIVPALLLLAGCDDSTNPLSPPTTSKPDERLVGVWRLRDKEGNVTYYHVGHPVEALPGSVIQVVQVTHTKQGLQKPIPVLAFPTVIGDRTYLNVTGQLIQERNGWKSNGYFLFRYQMDGERLLLWRMDTDAKETAIDSSKIRGFSDHEKSKKAWLRKVRFTDTTENLACFVANAGDSLWDTKELLRLERVDADQHDEAEKQALAAAESWLALTDEGNYDESWDAAAEYLRNAITKDRFVNSFNAARKPLGKLKSREVKSTEYRHEPAGGS